MYRILRSVDLDFSHHVRGHSGACINLHGHTWKFEVELSAEQLDEHGFVIDFGELEREVLLPCHELLDHSFACGAATFSETSAELAELGQRLLSSRRSPTASDRPQLSLAGARLAYPGGLKVAVFPFNPTSERLAQWLWALANERFATDRVRVHSARVYETLHPVVSLAQYSQPTR